MESDSYMGVDNSELPILHNGYEIWPIIGGYEATKDGVMLEIKGSLFDTMELLDEVDNIN